MKLEFIQTADDIIDFNKNHFGKKPLIRIFKIIFFISPILFTFNLMIMINSQGYSLGLLLNNLLPFLFFWGICLYMMFRFPRLIKRSFKKNNDSGERLIELLDEEISISTNQAKQIFKWSTIKQFKESENSYFIYLNPNQAIVVPKRIFEKYDQAAFKDLIKQKIQA